MAPRSAAHRRPGGRDGRAPPRARPRHRRARDAHLSCVAARLSRVAGRDGRHVGAGHLDAPEKSRAAFDWADHPLAGSAPLEAVDERYSYMQSFGPRDVVATHEHDGLTHPVVWTREHGTARIAVDLLGHDAESYASESHRQLIARLAGWAARA
ncbi:ThuA domain-containing protein [Microbacterium gubbeenense]|uniref:ThuA domain-containing protein n=1 Tax=Microbacterium gubbeenense TaxID=159896 RepID=UPI003F965376